MTTLGGREGVIRLTASRPWSGPFWLGGLLITVGVGLIELGTPREVVMVALLLSGDQIVHRQARREVTAFSDGLRCERNPVDSAEFTRALQAIPYRWPDSQPWP